MKNDITHIWLRTDGDHIVVEIERSDGTVREVIRELRDGPISHCWHNNNEGRPSRVFNGPADAMEES